MKYLLTMLFVLMFASTFSKETAIKYLVDVNDKLYFKIINEKELEIYDGTKFSYKVEDGYFFITLGSNSIKFKIINNEMVGKMGKLSYRFKYVYDLSEKRKNKIITNLKKKRSVVEKRTAIMNLTSIDINFKVIGSRMHNVNFLYFRKSKEGKLDSLISKDLACADLNYKGCKPKDNYFFKHLFSKEKDILVAHRNDKLNGNEVIILFKGMTYTTNIDFDKIDTLKESDVKKWKVWVFKTGK